jgi:hypothetical protein
MTSQFEMICPELRFESPESLHRFVTLNVIAQSLPIRTN